MSGSVRPVRLGAAPRRLRLRLRARARLRAMAFTACCALVAPTSALAQPAGGAGARSDGPLNLALPAGRLAGPGVPSVLPPRGDALAQAMAAAARRDVVQAGVETARQAVVDCQRGDYPGGGLGLLSLPFGRSAARTDHCFR